MLGYEHGFENSLKTKRFDWPCDLTPGSFLFDDDDSSRFRVDHYVHTRVIMSLICPSLVYFCILCICCVPTQHAQEIRGEHEITKQSQTTVSTTTSSDTTSPSLTQTDETHSLTPFTLLLDGSLKWIEVLHCSFSVASRFSFWASSCFSFFIPIVGCEQQPQFHFSS